MNGWVGGKRSGAQDVNKRRYCDQKVLAVQVLVGERGRNFTEIGLKLFFNCEVGPVGQELNRAAPGSS